MANVREMRTPDMGASLSGQRREVIALALPATLALAADPLLSLIDTALVGRLGPHTLAALGIDAAVFATVFWLCNFLTYGTTSEVARLHAGGEPDAAGARIIQALWLAIALGALITTLLLLAGPMILDAMGATGAVRAPALTYLRVRSMAAIPALIALVGHGAFRGLKDTRTPLRITLWLNGAAALLSWVLIYPVGWGIAGAAWGTVVAQLGAAVAFVVLLRRRLGPRATRPDLAAMRTIVRVSRDLFFRTASLVLALLLTTAATVRMGVATVGAHQIVRELWVLQTLALDGFAVAAQAMIATSLGRGELSQARREAAMLLRWGIGTGVVMGLIFLASINVLPGVFTPDEGVQAQARSVWWLVALLQPIGAVVFVLDGVFLGAHDYRYLLRWTALAALGVLVPVAWLSLQLDWGLQGVWWGMFGMIMARMAALLWRLRHWPSTAARVKA